MVSLNVAAPHGNSDTARRGRLATTPANPLHTLIAGLPSSHCEVAVRSQLTQAAGLLRPFANSIDSVTGLTPLTHACAISLPRMVSRSLVEALVSVLGACPSMRDAHWRSPVDAALLHSHVHLLDVLVVCGVSPNTADRRNVPLLARVARASHKVPDATRVRAMRALVALGADVHGGPPPSHNEFLCDEREPVRVSLGLRRLRDVVELLSLGANPRGVDALGNSAVHVACASVAKALGNSGPTSFAVCDAVDILRDLLELGVPARSLNHTGQTPFNVLLDPPSYGVGIAELTRGQRRGVRTVIREVSGILRSSATVSHSSKERDFSRAASWDGTARMPRAFWKRQLSRIGGAGASADFGILNVQPPSPKTNARSKSSAAGLIHSVSTVEAL